MGITSDSHRPSGLPSNNWRTISADPILTRKMTSGCRNNIQALAAEQQPVPNIAPTPHPAIFT